MGKRITSKEFVERSEKVHKNKYDYSKTTFNGTESKVLIICPIHGEFEQKAASHLIGKGCYKCGQKMLTKETFIKKAYKVHNSKYDYSLVEYFRYNEKIIIVCPTHGSFKQTPSHHLQGKGCKKCMKNNLRTAFQLTVEQFVEKAKQTHDDKYDYSLVKYINAHSKINIICKQHGVFQQEPNSHVRGNGCPRCAHSNRSKLASEWLRFLGVAEKEVPIKVNNKTYVVDGFDFTTNTVYEYYGDFWHGNPRVYDCDDLNKKLNKRYGELFYHTICRAQELINAGYKLIYKWETDYNMRVGTKCQMNIK